MFSKSIKSFLQLFCIKSHYLPRNYALKLKYLVQMKRKRTNEVQQLK